MYIDSMVCAVPLSLLSCSLVINVTPNLTSVCILLKGLHIAYYVHKLVYSRLNFIYCCYTLLLLLLILF